MTTTHKMPYLPVLGWLLTSLAVVVGYLWVVRPELRDWRGVATHGSAARPAIALTFDDGPHPMWTPLLADSLARHGARGTFFVVGMEAQRYPELVALLARGGHQVASHSLTHPYPNLTRQTPAQLDREVRDSLALLTQLTGQPVHDFRPPGGGVNNALIGELQRRQLRMAWWSFNAADAGQTTPELIVARLRRARRPGQVVLLHQRGPTVAAVERFLARDAGQYNYNTFSSVIQP